MSGASGSDGHSSATQGSACSHGSAPYQCFHDVAAKYPNLTLMPLALHWLVVHQSVLGARLLFLSKKEKKGVRESHECGDGESADRLCRHDNDHGHHASGRVEACEKIVNDGINVNGGA